MLLFNDVCCEESICIGKNNMNMLLKFIKVDLVEVCSDNKKLTDHGFPIILMFMIF